MTERDILIILEGGLVQDVFGVPAGYGLRVHDYDVEGLEADEIDTDDDGNEFYRGVWREPEPAKTIEAAMAQILVMVCQGVDDRDLEKIAELCREHLKCPAPATPKLSAYGL